MLTSLCRVSLVAAMRGWLALLAWGGLAARRAAALEPHGEVFMICTPLLGCVRLWHSLLGSPAQLVLSCTSCRVETEVSATCLL
jgi:hypothetical protein